MDEELELAKIIMAAFNGDKDAQCSLGTCYAEGSNGLAVDMIKARIWWRKAAEQNDAISTYNLYLVFMEMNHNSIANVYKKRLEKEAANGDQDAITFLSDINGEAIIEPNEITPVAPKNEIIQSNLDAQRYEDVKKNFVKYLTTEWTKQDGTPLPLTSASSYKSFVGKLISIYKEVNKDDSIDYLPQLCATDKEKFNSVVTKVKVFIQNQKSSSSGKDKKDWNNRNSAFNAYTIFLADLYDLEIDEEKEVVKVPVINNEPVTPNLTTTNEETLSYVELRNKFFSRLKTQGRYYPRTKIYFPIRILNKIFSDKGDTRLKDWMQNDLNNMDILQSADGSAVTFDSVKEMKITKDRKLIVRLADGTSFEAYTRTSRGSIIPLLIRKQWESITIDHKVSMSEIVDSLHQNFTGLNKLSDMLNNYVLENNIEPRVMIGSTKDKLLYVNAFYDKYKPELYTLRDEIMDDLTMMSLKYELMDHTENCMKGNATQSQNM